MSCFRTDHLHIVVILVLTLAPPLNPTLALSCTIILLLICWCAERLDGPVQDLVSLAWYQFSPKEDIVDIEVKMLDNSMPPMVRIGDSRAHMHALALSRWHGYRSSNSLPMRPSGVAVLAIQMVQYRVR